MLHNNIQDYKSYRGMLKVIKSVIYYFFIIQNNYKFYNLNKSLK